MCWIRLIQNHPKGNNYNYKRHLIQHLRGTCAVALLFGEVEMVLSMWHPELPEMKAEVVVAMSSIQPWHAPLENGRAHNLVRRWLTACLCRAFSLVGPKSPCAALGIPSQWRSMTRNMRHRCDVAKPSFHACPLAASQQIFMAKRCFHEQAGRDMVRQWGR